TPARKPRTECDCQPVVFVSAAMVAPPGERSMPIAADCFVPDRTAATRLPLCPTFLSFGRLLNDAADRAAVCFFALFIIGDLLRISCSLRAAPPKPRRSSYAGGAGSRSNKSARGSKHSSAPITSKCQSFLNNLVAQIADNRPNDDPMGTRYCPLCPRKRTCAV